MKIELTTERVEIPQPPIFEERPIRPLHGRVIFDNKDIVRLVRAEAQRLAGVPEDEIKPFDGSVRSVKTGALLPSEDLVMVEF